MAGDGEKKENESQKGQQHNLTFQVKCICSECHKNSTNNLCQCIQLPGDANNFKVSENLPTFFIYNNAESNKNCCTLKNFYVINQVFSQVENVYDSANVASTSAFFNLPCSNYNVLGVSESAKVACTPPCTNFDFLSAR